MEVKNYQPTKIIPVPLGTESAFTVSMRRKNIFRAIPKTARIRRYVTEPRRLRKRLAIVSFLVGMGNAQEMFALRAYAGKVTRVAIKCRGGS